MDRIMTKTLAEIYIQQGHFEEAYEILKALSEKDPSDMEIQKRLMELSEKLKRSSPLAVQSIRTAEEKIRLLERWLTNIQERKRG
jgi:DNA-binding SARP family transcriptional activator